MKTVTVDRAEIIHFAGFHHLSPALDDRSGPAFSTAPGDGLARCGWQPFFKTMRAHQVALEFDADDAASARFVAHPPGPREHTPGSGFGHAMAHSRRFWAALFPARERSESPTG